MYAAALLGASDGESDGNPDGAKLGVLEGPALGAREGGGVLGGMLGTGDGAAVGLRLGEPNELEGKRCNDGPSEGHKLGAKPGSCDGCSDGGAVSVEGVVVEGGIVGESVVGTLVVGSSDVGLALVGTSVVGLLVVVGDGVGAGVHASVLQATASLSAALQACATPAEAVATDRARLAAPDPQGTVQLLHAVQAEMAQSVHVKAAHGVVSVSPPHWAPPKAAASIMYFKRDEEPAAPQTQVQSHSDTRACGRKRLASTDACERTYVPHTLTCPRLQNRANHTHANNTRFD